MCWCFDVSGEWCSRSSTCPFDIWPPTVQSPLKRVWQYFDIWWDIFAATWMFACLWNRVVKHLAFSTIIRTWIHMNMFWRCSLTLTGLQTVSGRRSVSCCIVMFGRCLIYSASRTQKIISLSSAEAEVYACSSGASDAILLARLLTWITNKRTHIYIYTDSHWQQWCQRNFESKGSWTFEALEFPHLVVAGYGWEWNAEVMQQSAAIRIPLTLERNV